MPLRFFKSIIVFIAFSGSIYAQATFNSNSAGGGNWSDNTKWTIASGTDADGIPDANDVVVILPSHAMNVDVASNASSVTLNGGALAANLTINAGISLTVAGAVSIAAPTGAVDNSISVGTGTLTCGSFSTANSGANTRRCVLNIGSGLMTCSGNFSMANNTTRNKLIFSSSGTLQMGGTTNTLANAQFTPSTSTIEYNASGAQTILSLSYSSLKCSGSGTKTLAANTVLTASLLVEGTAQLDVSASNFSLTVGGNWTITSTNADPFVQQSATVTLNGAALQTISTVLAGGETFYNLTCTNSSALIPGISFSQALTISNNMSVNVASCYVNIASDLNISAASTLGGSATGGTFSVAGNLNAGAGAAIGGTNTIIVSVTGNLVPAGALTLANATISVTGTTDLNGTLSITNTGGTKTFGGALTVNNGALIDFTAAETIALSNNLVMNGTSSITGSGATGVVNVSGSFNISASAVSSIENITLSVISTTTIDGTLSVTGASGTKTLTGTVTVNNGGSISFGVVETLSLSGALMLNGTSSVALGPGGILSVAGACTVAGTSSVNSTTTGNFNLSSGLTVNAGVTFTVADVNLAVSGASTIAGTISFTSSNGTKSFGAITVNSGGTWDCSAIDETFTMVGALTNNGTFNASATNGSSTMYSFSGASSINGTLTIPRITVSANTTTNNATLTITTELAGAGSFTQGATGNLLLTLDPNTNFTITTFVASAAGNIVVFSFAGAHPIRNVVYNDLTLLSSGIKSLIANCTVNGNLTIGGSAQLDVTASNYNLTVKGNWTASSSNPDPFVERTGTVTFSGTGAQAISNATGTETFYRLVVNNTSGLSPAISTSAHMAISSEYDHTAGILNLTGKNLTVTSNPGVSNGYVTCDLSGGSIISTIAGSAISFTDVDDSTYVDFSGTDVGSSSVAIPLTVDCGRICVSGLEIYGVASFTKTLDSQGGDDCNGGNKFRNSVTFTVPSSGSRWRMGTNLSQPDTFFAAVTFNANANGIASNNNFIIGANSIGNYYASTVSATSTTNGGLFFGRSNGTGQNTHTFNGAVDVNVSLTGNVSFSEGSSLYTNTCTFNSTLRLNSLATSTGDINIGTNQYSNVIISSTGQLIDGNILGATNVNFKKVTQLGTLAQSTLSSAATQSTINVGGANNCSCVWNGNLTLTSPNINLDSSTFNGTTNIFTANGSASQNYVGGNNFSAGTTATFINTGAGDWLIGTTDADNYDGDVVYRRTGTGSLSPANNTSCTYAGNITIDPASTQQVTFATGTSGRVVIDGNSSKSFTNATGITVDMKRITMSKTSGNFTLNAPITMATGGDLTLTSGKIITTSTNVLTLTDETNTCTLGNNTSYIDGPMKYTMSVANSARTLNFPVGKSNDWRPFSLTLTHNAATAFTYTGELTNASAAALGYTLPASVSAVSQVHYWDIDRSATGNLTLASVTLNYSLTDGTDDVVPDPTNLRIVKTIGSGTVWNNIGGTGSAAGTGTITSSVNFTTFSRFTLANATGGTNPLPVELTDFTAKKCGEVVCLNWSTASESNNDYFVVEKSTDGVNFESLLNADSKAPNGNSFGPLAYDAKDFSPVKGINYYRLKQVDFDGTSNASQIVVIDFSGEKTIAIFPNPNNGVFNVHFDGAGSLTSGTVRVMNSLGQLMYEEKIGEKEFSTSTYKLNIADKLSPGVYYFSIVTNKTSTPYRFVVE